MIGLIQRVSSARVEVGQETVGSIGAGMLLLVCVQPDDTHQSADRFLAKVLKMRIFSDEQGKMNRSIASMHHNGAPGELLLVSQFTLAADLSGGNRPGFTGAAPPDLARPLVDYLISQARKQLPKVATGRFGTDMQVHLVNDGPVTIPIYL